MNIKWVKKNFILILIASLLIVNIFVWYAVIVEEREGNLAVAFLDVGQGDSILIEAPNGNQILIDGGSNKKVLRQLGDTMPFYDRSIDVVLATHPDKDHIGGLPDVLNRYNVGVIVASDVESDTSIYNEFEKIIEGKKIKKIFARAGQVIWLSDDVYIEILFPDRDTSGLESNTASIVTRLVYGSTEFLFTGDSPKSIEKYLTAQYGEKLRSDVLKLGHHGSRTSTSEIFLSAVSPQVAIVSAGTDNRYGHPHKEVTDILKEFEIPSLATYESGTIMIKSDGENIYIK